NCSSICYATRSMPPRKLKGESKPAGLKKMANSKFGSATKVRGWRIPLIYSFHSSLLKRAVPVSDSCCRAKSPKLTAARSRSRIAPKDRAAKPVCVCRSDWYGHSRSDLVCQEAQGHCQEACYNALTQDKKSEA